MKGYFGVINCLQRRISSTRVPSTYFFRAYSQNPDFDQHEPNGPTGPTNPRKKMSGWQIHEYGGIEILQCSDNIKIPIIKNPSDVLVEVHAASINPIDVLMMGGYGSALLNAVRCKDGIEFPLTLGRDFCGIVKKKGMNVREEIQVGDKVWGVVSLHRAGSHAEFVAADENCLSHKPNNMDDTEAAATLYAGLTAWSGLFVTGQLGGVAGALSAQGGGRGQKICILGGSGGVGSMAIQIAKAENLHVTVSCSPDACELVERLGADEVVDYKAPDAIDRFCRNGPYNIILDCAGKGGDYATQLPWQYDQYITFTSPTLQNIDTYGLAGGLVKNLYNIVENNLQSVTKNRALVKWAYFIPAPQGISYLGKLVERKKLKPVIDSAYDFSSTYEAYQKVANGNLRGKVVINMK